MCDVGDEVGLTGYRSFVIGTWSGSEQLLAWVGGYGIAVEMTYRRFDSGSEDCITVFSTS